MIKNHFCICVFVWFCLGVVACKKPVVRNLQVENRRHYLVMNCPPYGDMRFYIGDMESLGEDWEPEQTQCLNWIQENWTTLWPIVEVKLNQMAENYAYGEKSLEPHLRNPVNYFDLSPIDDNLWSLALEINLKHGGHAFCIDMKRDQVLEYQPVY